MDIFIETLTGVSFELHVSPNETVMSIKSKIQRAEGIPVTQQHLIWKNDELDDHRRLHDYFITGGSTLRLVLGLRGGPLNAHRVPPLRLTPIHLSPSTTPMISKLSKIAGDRSRSTQLSRLTLPALSPSGIRTSSKQAMRPVNPSHVKLSGTGDSETALNEQSSGQETIGLDNKTQTMDEHSPDLLATSLSKLTTSNSSSLSSELSQNRDCSRFHSVSQNSPSKSKSRWFCEGQSRSRSATIMNPSLSADEAAASDFKTESLGITNTSLDIPADQIDRVQNTSVSASLSSPRSPKAHSGGDSFGPGLSATGLLEGRQESNIAGTARPSSPPLDYPPLIDSSSRVRHPLNSFDLSSYWRLYEHSEMTTVSQSALHHSRFPLVGMTEQDNDSSPSSAPGSDRDSPTGGFNLIIQSDSATNPSNGIDDFAFTNSDVSSATATILAGLLSVTGDRLALPCQTSGNERGYGRGRYSWLRPRASPLLEATDELTHAAGSDACHWGTGVTDEEQNAIGTPALYELGAGAHEDENGEGDPEDDDLDDDDDDDDGDSVETKGAYTCGPEDDDSLADLEDYLFFHRTADLLFGPPIASIYSPYSYSYSGRGAFSGENWRNEFEADFGVTSNRERRKDSSSRAQNGTAWHQERTQLAEKVQDLKSRMREARVRRQSRRRRDVQGREIVAQIPNCRKKEDPQRSSPATLPDHPSNVNPGCFTNVELSPPGRTSPVIHSAISDSHLEQRPRQRRFGTVTPPEPSLIVHLNTNERQLKSPRQSVIQHASSDPCSIVSASPPSDCSNTLPCIRVDGMASLVAQNAVLTKEDSSGQNPGTYKEESTSRVSPSPCAVSVLAKPPSALSPRALSHGLNSGAPQYHQFLPTLVGNIPNQSLNPVRLLSAGESRARVCSRLSSSGGNLGMVKTSTNKVDGSLLRPLAAPSTPVKGDTSAVNPRSPLKPHSSNGMRRKRCALCLRKIGIVNSYSCRCGRNFCSRHRYAEVHACPFDYKAEARRTLIDSNPVVTAPKLPKI